MSVRKQVHLIRVEHYVSVSCMRDQNLLKYREIYRIQALVNLSDIQIGIAFFNELTADIYFISYDIHSG